MMQAFWHVSDTSFVIDVAVKFVAVKMNFYLLFEKKSEFRQNAKILRLRFCANVKHGT